jgi:hypothetical protein
MKPQDGPAATTKEQIMTTQTKTTGEKPSHRIFQVTGRGESANWTPVGAAWPNRDGHGFSMVFDAIPVHGRTVMRLITERTEAAPAE